MDEIGTTNAKGLCPHRLSGRYCKQPEGHDGQCAYKNIGGQGGNWVHWWGANPRPVGWVDDYSWTNLREEIYRLRRLCEAEGIDWTENVTQPGDNLVVTPAELPGS